MCVRPQLDEVNKFVDILLGRVTDCVSGVPPLEALICVWPCRRVV